MSIKRLLTGKKPIFLTTAVTVFIVAVGIFLHVAYVPVIIMYHSVDSEAKATLDGYGSKLNVLPATFEKQMKFLKKRNYNVIPLEEFIERVRSGKRIPYKTLAITFDDGLKNNFTNAYPVLRKYNFPATIFVATDFIGKENFLSADDIKTLQKNNISIGSHTVSHSWLPSLDESAIKKELFESKKILEGITNSPVRTLSYPLGAFDRRVEKIAEEAGYIGAVTTNPGKRFPCNDPYALKRIRISMTSDNLLTFWIETSGYYTFIKEHRDED